MSSILACSARTDLVSGASIHKHGAELLLDGRLSGSLLLLAQTDLTFAAAHPLAWFMRDHLAASCSALAGWAKWPEGQLTVVVEAGLPAARTDTEAVSGDGWSPITTIVRASQSRNASSLTGVSGLTCGSPVTSAVATDHSRLHQRSRPCAAGPLLTSAAVG